MTFFKSIRFRLAMWSALITGLVVLVFGAVSTTLLYHEYLETLDEEMDGFAEDLAEELEDEDDFDREDLVDLFDLFDDRDSLHLIAVVSPRGKTIFRSSHWENFNLEVDSCPPSSYQTVTHRGNRWRIWREREDGWHIFVGTQLQVVYRALLRILVACAIAFPLAMLLAALGGLLLARKAMRPVQAITRTAEEISVRDLSHRIPEQGMEDDELGQLASVFNAMLDRLQASFEQASRFSSDASHELNTPLTVMQGELEAALQKKDFSEEDHRLLGNLLEETERLKIITRSLLLFSRSDAGTLQPESQTVNLTEILQNLVDDTKSLDSAQGLEFRIALPENIEVPGDPVLLRQAFHNLLSNTVRYNRENGWVQVSLSRERKRLFARSAIPARAPHRKTKIASLTAFSGRIPPARVPMEASAWDCRWPGRSFELTAEISGSNNPMPARPPLSFNYRSASQETRPFNPAYKRSYHENTHSLTYHPGNFFSPRFHKDVPSHKSRIHSYQATRQGSLPGRPSALAGMITFAGGCGSREAGMEGSGQSSFRVRSGFQAELNADEGWAGELNESVAIHADQPFRIRFEIEPSAGTEGMPFGLQYRRNGGAWTPVEAHGFPYPERSVQSKLPEFKDYTLENTTRLGCGYDFRLQRDADRSFLAVEVKGLTERSGGISLTPKEHEVARALANRFYLFVVKNFRDSPFHEIYRNPTSGELHFAKKERVVIHVSWLATV